MKKSEPNPPFGPRYMDEVKSWEDYWDSVYEDEYIRYRPSHELEHGHADGPRNSKDKEEE